MSSSSAPATTSTQFSVSPSSGITFQATVTPTITSSQSFATITRPAATEQASATNSSLAESSSTLSITRQVSVSYCEQVVVSWSGGVGPFSLEAFSPSVDVDLIAQTNERSWSFPNVQVKPGNIMSITVKDSQNLQSTDMFIVDGIDRGECTAVTTATVAFTPASTSAASISPSRGAELSAAGIVAIVLGVLSFLAIIGTAIWFYRRKAASRPQPVLPHHHAGKAGDRSSIISEKKAASIKSTRSVRSALSLWSTFSDHQNPINERSNSMESGVRVDIDTVQVVEEARTPVTAQTAGEPLFNPRRTTREWTGYGASGNRRPSDENDSFNPSTILSTSSITDESTQIEFPNHQPMPKPDYSPFNDNYIVPTFGDHKDPIMPSHRSDHTEPSEQDASQLSHSDLEALADIVAARLNQRTQYSSSSSEIGRTGLNATDLPPRYF